MDHMSMGGGTPWLDQPVMLHSSRADTCKLTPEQCAYRSGYWRYWYQADYVYAQGTVYFFVATVGLCFLGFWTQRLAPTSLRNRGWWNKGLAGVRFLAYRRYETPAIRWRMPSLGVGVLLTAGFLFFLLMTLGPQPYYWPNTQTLSYGSSPPIATRTGWMALACLPFMLILPTKANMIASLTGVSHERLIVFHNWVGWAMFALALVHTFPFIVFHIWKGDMVHVWNTSVVYWTGVVALIAQAYLQIFSLRSIRDYFIATGVLYTLAFFYPQIRTFFEFGISNRATFTMVSDTAMKITIPIDTTWQPGQHMFLRFVHMGLHAFTAHPFTICSIPARRNSVEKSRLTFYVQPRGGLTGRLAKAASQRPGFSVPVLIDGPYGGVRGRPLNKYDYNLIVACGAGASFSLPFVMEGILRAAWQARNGNREPLSKMHVVMATRDPQLVHWYEEAVVEFLEENGLDTIPEEVIISVYQTGRPESKPNSTSKEPEQSDEKHGVEKMAVRQVPINVYSGRPDLGVIIKEATLQSGVSVGIAACGPGGVLKQVQDEAAAAQLRVAGSVNGAREVYLHSEVFSW
ncbi:putative FRE ferric reductase-like transmembrane component [Durotheca rogersii]|uniref:putative FRE ferric reductase-like transmembrane component n=1 Tax=Durotheca rogersii TaxID=419775 RepID=UPI002220D9DC|nr:putative FRE ferric reductase-like transmembrane component [Durotheca rogersii]KAI5862495.1 putative FRE ferric reductase-like transmembrane component [Durotheca rogersii]